MERLRSSVAIWRRTAREVKISAVAVMAPRVNVRLSWMRVELWCSQVDMVACRRDGYLTSYGGCYRTGIVV